MLPFLSNLYSFKGAARRISHYSNSLGAFPHDLDKNDLAHLLIDDNTNYPSDIERLYKVVSSLYKRLYPLNNPPSNSQMLNHLANASIGASYQHLKAKLPLDSGSFRTYWNMPEDLLTSMMASSSDVITHDFPQELDNNPIINLQSWKFLWLIDCQSSLMSPFMIPIPPNRTFGENTKYHNLTTWKQGDSFRGSEYFDIVVEDEQNRKIGYLSWYFWGGLNEIKGSGFTFRYLKDGVLEISFGFDLRPCYSEVSSLRQIETKLSSYNEFQEYLERQLEYKYSLHIG